LRDPHRRLIKVEEEKHPYSRLHKYRSGFLKRERYDQRVWLIEGIGNPEKRRNYNQQLDLKERDEQLRRSEFRRQTGMP
jgi:hypothetical protein